MEPPSPEPWRKKRERESHFGSSREWFKDVGCRTAPFLSLLSLLFWRPSVLNRGAYPLPPCAAFSPPLLNEDLGKTALFSPTASQGRPRCATQHEGVHYSLFLGEYPDRGLYVIGVLTFYELDPIPPGEYLERGLPVRKVHDSGQDKEGAIHKLCLVPRGQTRRACAAKKVRPTMVDTTVT